MSDDERDSISPFLEALDRAHEAQTRYDTAAQLAAEGEDVNPRAERIRFQQAVLAMWKRLRPYLRTQLERWWEEAVIWDPEGSEEGLVGLKTLHHYQGATRSTTEFGPNDSVQTDQSAVLLPPAAVRNALDLLTECAFHLGMMPEAQTGRRIGNVDVKTAEDGDPQALMRHDDEQDTETSGA